MVFRNAAAAVVFCFVRKEREQDTHSFVVEVNWRQTRWILCMQCFCFVVVVVVRARCGSHRRHAMPCGGVSRSYTPEWMCHSRLERNFLCFFLFSVFRLFRYCENVFDGRENQKKIF